MFTTTREETHKQIKRACSNLTLDPPSEYVRTLIAGTDISYTGYTLSFHAPSYAKGNEEYKKIIEKLIDSLNSVSCFFDEAIEYTLTGLKEERYKEERYRQTLKNAAAEKKAAAAAERIKTDYSSTEAEPTTSSPTTYTSLDIINSLVNIFGDQNKVIIEENVTSELVDYQDNSSVLNYVLQFLEKVKVIPVRGSNTQIEAHDVLTLIQRIPKNDSDSYCTGLKLFKNLMTTLTTKITRFEFSIPTGTMDSLNRSVRSCASISDASSQAGGGSKSRRRHRRHHKSARKTRRGRTRKSKSKSKSKPKTHRRRRHSRVRKSKRNTYTRRR